MMAADITTMHLNYIKNYLITEILEKLENETIDTFDVKFSGGLDGFMSALYKIELKTKTKDGSIKERSLIAKFMKGDNAFRESSKSYVQFANEIYIYATVMPEYEKIIRAAKLDDLSVENWIAHSYVAKFGYVEGLSATPKTLESVLVLDNLAQEGYTLGSRIYLSLEQLFAMCKVLGEYHALNYVVRLQHPALFERLKAGIVPLPFVANANDADGKNIFTAIYRVAFDRFFEYYHRKVDDNTFDRKNAEDIRFIECVRKLREKYFEQPTKLLEHLRTSIEEHEEDRRFAAILHGDYNRNNVLFLMKKTEQADGSDIVKNVRMIDFQELRYGTPAIDLGFFMYVNSTKEIREEYWMDMLETYYSTMYDTMAAILSKTGKEQDVIDDELEKYTFSYFLKHFQRYAFYGVMISLHFVPWLLCSEQECAKLAHSFETDMHGEEFRKISIEAGGDFVNDSLLEILKHACQMGYMDNL